MSAPRNLMLFAVLAPLLAASAQDAQSPAPDPVRLVDGGASVELSLDDARVADFLAAAQPILRVPIHSEPSEVVPTRLHQEGVQRVPLAAFRDEFDAVLRREGFWNWDDASGGAPVIVVRQALVGKFLGKIPFTPRVIGLEELAAGPAQRGPQYTMVFPLTHVSARSLLNVVDTILDIANESVRHVEGANQLLVTASREHLLAVRDALARMDVPGPEAPGLAVDVADLRLKVTQLEQRLAALEKKAGG
jgi:hypothetical protein